MNSILESILSLPTFLLPLVFFLVSILNEVGLISPLRLLPFYFGNTKIYDEHFAFRTNKPFTHFIHRSSVEERFNQLRMLSNSNGNSHNHSPSNGSAYSFHSTQNWWMIVQHFFSLSTIPTVIDLSNGWTQFNCGQEGEKDVEKSGDKACSGFEERCRSEWQMKRCMLLSYGRLLWLVDIVEWTNGRAYINEGSKQENINWES